MMLPRLVRLCDGVGSKTLTIWHDGFCGNSCNGRVPWLSRGNPPFLFGDDPRLTSRSAAHPSSCARNGQFLAIVLVRPAGHCQPIEMLGLLITTRYLCRFAEVWHRRGRGYIAMYTVSGIYLYSRPEGLTNRRSLLPSREDWLIVKRSANRLASSAGLA